MVHDIDEPLEKHREPPRSSGFWYLKCQEPVRFYTVGKEGHDELTSSTLTLHTVPQKISVMSRVQCGGRVLYSNDFIHACVRTCRRQQEEKEETWQIDIVDPKQNQGFRLVISQASLATWKQMWAEIEDVAAKFRRNDDSGTMKFRKLGQPLKRPTNTCPSFQKRARVNPSSVATMKRNRARVASKESLLVLHHEKVRLDIQKARLDMQKAKSDMAKNRFDVLYTLFSSTLFHLDEDKKKATQEKLMELAKCVVDGP